MDWRRFVVERVGSVAYFVAHKKVRRWLGLRRTFYPNRNWSLNFLAQVVPDPFQVAAELLKLLIEELRHGLA